ncbi:MAG: TIGR03862 family flavoprotein [Gammaproteobacteria bacterium]|nr:TIGR03862 family flavoprotein [Gammaproteobacteria bacterium]
MSRPRRATTPSSGTAAAATRADAQTTPHRPAAELSVAAQPGPARLHGTDAGAHARIAVIGAGPAGLMAAETAVAGGARVDVYDAMPSIGRKFLLAGRGGLNLTHSEPFEGFVARFGTRSGIMAPLLRALAPAAVREWARGLGVETFVGSSGRVFPLDRKAAPLLRAWRHRLRASGVKLHLRHRWRGWNDRGALVFATPAGDVERHADAVILALGGASWPRFGSDGAWVALLAARGIRVQALRPANCGFDVHWSEHLRSRFAGAPVKSIVARVRDRDGAAWCQPGEMIVTANGIEGGVVYALAAVLRDRIERDGSAVLEIDLAPGHDLARLETAFARPRGKRSLATRLRRIAGLEGVKTALLHECAAPDALAVPQRLAAAIKSLPLRLRAPRPLAEAISSAGGVVFEALDARLMLDALPGVFCAGEMLDWEAPTGGYLLTACLATGRAAGAGACDWLRARARADGRCHSSPGMNGA